MTLLKLFFLSMTCVFTLKAQDTKTYQVADKKLFLSSYAASSIALVTEKPPQYNSVYQTQKSLLTMGISGKYQLNVKHFLTSSFYFASMSDAAIEDKSDHTKTMPWDLGASLRYHRFIFPNSRWTPFIGFDFEKISTFNSDEIAADENYELRIIEQKLLFFTLGATFSTEFNKRPVSFRFNLGNTVVSQTSAKHAKSYKGLILGLNSSWNVHKKWSALFFGKWYMLDGLGELNIFRFGLGVGYSFY